MTRKRPCRICRRWFQPDPRAGDRQRVCSEASCQRERHRRSCARWRDDNAVELEADRLRDRLRRSVPEAGRTDPGRAPMAELRLEVVRDVVGPEVAVILEESAEVLGRWVRDAVAAQPLEITGEFVRHPRPLPQDAIASSRGPP